MGLFDTAALEELLAKGCPCGSTKLTFETYVDARYTLLGGEQYGSLVWAYKGETFVDGVFEIACAACKKVLFHEDACPRCNAEGALPEILATENRLPLPVSCNQCGTQKLNLTAMVPATVLYQGKRGEKARASADMADEGFHGVRVDCVSCGNVATVGKNCPLCAAPGPLRARPS